NWVLSYSLYDSILGITNGRGIPFALDPTAETAQTRNARIFSLRPGKISGKHDKEEWDAEWSNVNPVDRLGAVQDLKVPMDVPVPPVRTDTPDGTGLNFDLSMAIYGKPLAPGDMGHRIRFGSFDLWIADQTALPAFENMALGGNLLS